MKKYRAVPIAFCFALASSYSSGGANVKEKKMSNPQSTESDVWIPLRVGRFSLSVPETLKRAGQRYDVRQCSVTEIQWPTDVPREQARAAELKSRTAEIKKLAEHIHTGPAVVEVKPLGGSGDWGSSLYCREAFEPAESDEPEESVKPEEHAGALIDGGPSGIWVTCSGWKEYMGDLLERCVSIAKTYQSLPVASSRTAADAFHLQWGALAGPFQEEEDVNVRFVGHRLDLTLLVEMNTIHEAEKGPGLLGRIAASALTQFAPGVHVKKLRSGARTVAGLKGEEMIAVIKDDYKTVLSFTWLYLGQPDSGSHPRFLLDMETPPGQEKEKMQLWDRILQSVVPTTPKG